MQFQSSPSTPSGETTSAAIMQISPDTITPTTFPHTSRKSTDRMSPLSLSWPRPPSHAQERTPSPTLLRSLVISYLLHNCYEKTARAILETDGDDDTEANGDGNGNGNGNDGNRDRDRDGRVVTSAECVAAKQNLGKRRSVMNCIKTGDIQCALQQTDALLDTHTAMRARPDAKTQVTATATAMETSMETSTKMGTTTKTKTTLRDAFPQTYAQMLCQNFTELCRTGKSLDALHFARDKVVPFGREFGDALVLIRGYLPLLAYEEPHLSPVYELVDVGRRHTLADEVNGCMMAWCGGRSDSMLCTVSVLERILRQLIAVMRRNDGKTWCLDDVYQVMSAKV